MGEPALSIERAPWQGRTPFFTIFTQTSWLRVSLMARKGRQRDPTQTSGFFLATKFIRRLGEEFSQMGWLALLIQELLRSAWGRLATPGLRARLPRACADLGPAGPGARNLNLRFADSKNVCPGARGLGPAPGARGVAFLDRRGGGPAWPSRSLADPVGWAGVSCQYDPILLCVV